MFLPISLPPPPFSPFFSLSLFLYFKLSLFISFLLLKISVQINGKMFQCWPAIDGGSIFFIFLSFFREGVRILTKEKSMHKHKEKIPFFFFATLQKTIWSNLTLAIFLVRPWTNQIRTFLLNAIRNIDLKKMKHERNICSTKIIPVIR